MKSHPNRSHARSDHDRSGNSQNPYGSHQSELLGCARIHARDFLQSDTLTITSMLPGVPKNYQEYHAVSRCGIARFSG
jgi:hypothetical protein